MAYGYGVSVTPLQLAHAYATIGAMGISRPVSFLRVDGPVAGERVMDENVARQLVHLLESVILPSGTGLRAAIPGYRVAGKTGTAFKSNQGGYSTDRYVAVFGGLAPATNPRLATVVVIDEPGAGLHHGGDVAAPVFANLVGGALRLLAVAPDAPINVPLDEMPGSNLMPGTPSIAAPVPRIEAALLPRSGAAVQRR
jgi:cell division protein FtsI (penicillin-binding protein 3)